MKQIETIDDVIIVLNNIIADNQETNNALGYFAVLYKKVTISVKNGIQNNFFDDGARMEKLDVVFAERYIDAYYAWKQNKKVTQSWEKTFLLSNNSKMLVLQHLLLGMNAHINLDLGIAAANISTKENIHDLRNDFDKINQILASKVDEVQFGLSAIWPALKWILKRLGKIDNYLVDFSIEIARDGAWDFATSMIQQNMVDWPDSIQLRDIKVADISRIITQPGKGIQFLLWLIRLGERGSVSEKMNKLKSLASEKQLPNE